MRQKRILEIWVGLFVGFGIVALLAVAFYVGGLADGLHNKNGYWITAQFGEIGGLKTRAPVRISGVQVGRVQEILLDSSNYRATVVLELDAEKLPLQRVKSSGEVELDAQGRPALCSVEELETATADCTTALYQDASASILTSGMLGEQYIGLEPGGGAEKFLRPGEEIQMTQSSIALEQVIGHFLMNRGSFGGK